MTTLRRRIERLEQSLRPELRSNPYADLIRQSLESLSTDDLLLLIAISESGKGKGEWTERESAAVRALGYAYEEEVKRAVPSVGSLQPSRTRLSHAPLPKCTF